MACCFNVLREAVRAGLCTDAAQEHAIGGCMGSAVNSETWCAGVTFKLAAVHPHSSSLSGVAVLVICS